MTAGDWFMYCFGFLMGVAGTILTVGVVGPDKVYNNPGVECHAGPHIYQPITHGKVTYTFTTICRSDAP